MSLLDKYRDYKTKKELYKDAKEQNNRASAYKFIEKFGTEEPQKAKEMALVMVDNWKLDDSYISDRTYSIAKRFDIQDVLENKIEEFVNSNTSKLDDYYKAEQQSDFFDYAVLDLLNFVVERNMQKEIPILQDFVIRNIEHSRKLLTGYAEYLKKNGLIIDESAYEYIIKGNNVREISDLAEKKPNLMDYRRIFLGKIENEYSQLEKNKDFRNLDSLIVGSLKCSLSCKQLFSDKDIEHIIEIALTTKGLNCVQDYVLYHIKDFNIKPEVIENFIVENKCYTNIVDIAKMKGIDAKKLEQMVLDKQDFWLSYAFATQVGGADTKAHLEIMELNMPRVSMETVTYNHAYFSLMRSYKNDFKIFGLHTMPAGDIPEEDVYIRLHELQSRAINRYEEETNRLNRAISEVKSMIRDEKKTKVNVAEGRER